MINEKEQEEIIEKRARYFYENKTKVHVSLVTNKWLNGTIIEFFGDGFIIDENVEGKQPVFFIEILPNGITEYKKAEVKNETVNKV